MKIALVIISVFLFFGCANSRKKEDNIISKTKIMNSLTAKNDTIYVKEFSEFNKNDIGKIDSVDYYTKIKIQKFSTKNMKNLVSKKKVSCIIFWASWCKGCKWMLDSAYRDIIKKHQKNVNFAIISISNKLKDNQKELFKLKYFMQTYVLDPNLYKSTSEFDDFPILESYFKEQFPHEKLELFVPFVMLIDKNKKIISKDQDYYNLNILLSKLEK
ncbi:MAG: thioredoxin domain-containing protein [Bacteroidota bacterium]